ncbi:hypothetical protein MTR_6g043860 [Medicago truncatula]|uniref:Uncharacterized protein n=1 Tax=Medicago truncatula TaxID=3880 RepID=A0A072UJQ0_MEDTR|nr:hypothetical protein MTR_6g043860 [Medicago truncatula]
MASSSSFSLSFPPFPSPAQYYQQLYGPSSSTCSKEELQNEGLCHRRRFSDLDPKGMNGRTTSKILEPCVPSPDSSISRSVSKG